LLDCVGVNGGHGALNAIPFLPVTSADTSEERLAPPEQSAQRPPRRLLARSELANHLLLAAVAYLPVLLAHPGKLAADTKSYLYINPAGVMRQAFYMWDPFVGNGTVTHQYIGYLFPMGPYYWVVQHLGVPMWVGQRVWLGSILFGAGSGVLYFLRHLHVSGPGRPVAAIAYMLTPYVLPYAARLSALLLPWAAIGWLVGLTALSLRRGGWRYPAIFALIVLATGTVNATSLIYAGFAPLLYVFYAVWGTRECNLADALKAVARTALLSIGVIAWTVVGLIIEFSYALNIVIYTESIPTVTLTSSASEVIRGLGYWYFYGEDTIDHYVQAAPPYMTAMWHLVVGFALPAVQFCLAAVARWRYRAYCVMLVVVGTVLAVGAYPYRDSTPFGALLKAFQAQGIAGLALRSDNRAVPVLLLGLAGLTASGISTLWMRNRRLATVAGLAVAGGAVASLPSLFTGTIIGSNLLFPSHLPSYYGPYARYLDSHQRSTRVLDEPGDDFAYYTWGTTIDPVDPALIDRPFVAREQVPYGSASSADLLNAFDETLQEETFDPLGVAPIARLMSAGDFVLRSDLDYERFNTPRPQPTWALFNPPPPGLGKPVTFGKPQPKKPAPYPLVDETALAEFPSAPWPPPLAVFPVSHPRPIVRTEAAKAPIVLDGGGKGIVESADSGLLANNDTIFYSPTFTKDPSKLRRIIDRGATLVVTDSNYLAQRRWGTVRENVGYIQQPREPVLVKDPTAHPLPVFPGETIADQTVALLSGVKHVVASSYGNPISFVPENQPYNAFDGNLDTVWTTGAFSNPDGQYIQVELDRPVTTDHLVLVQPLHGPRDRYITQVTLSFYDGRHGHKSHLTVRLGPASRTPKGQTVRFSTGTFTTLRVRIDRNNMIHAKAFAGVSGVGFAEIGIPGVTLHETVRMPTDLLHVAGAASESHALVLIMSRRQAPPVPPRTDPELSMTRQFTLPTARTFSISGTARISALIPDQTIDQLMGRPGSGGSLTSPPYTSTGPLGIVASSSGRLPGDLNARASMALDGNPATAWMPGIGPQKGGWIQVNLPTARTFDHLDLQVVDDGRHSVPTRITLSSQSGSEVVSLPSIPNRRRMNAVAEMPINFPFLKGSWLRLTIDATRNVTNRDYYSDRPVIEPVGIAELGIPGVIEPPVPEQFPTLCRDDLIAIDGKPVWVAVTGSNQTAGAEQGPSLTYSGCGPDASGITLTAGTHVLTTANGSDWHYGINIDTVQLASDPGGGAMAVRAGALLPSPTPPPAPRVRILAETPVSYRLSISKTRSPYWLVLGQSLNPGWTASIVSAGRHPTSISLGAPTLIDAMSNGWEIDPHRLGSAGPFTVVVRWTPQRWVLPSLIFSGAVALLCLLLALWPRRRTPRRPQTGSRSAPPALSRPRTGAGFDSLIGADNVAGYPFRLRRALVAAASMGLVAGLLVNGWLALPVAAVTAAACRWRLVRLLLAAGGPALLVVTAGYYAAEQFSGGWQPLFGWPTHFQEGNTLVWLAILALASLTAATVASD
jgi:arabinofuranan 3-O-arabinosyltransferase